MLIYDVLNKAKVYQIISQDLRNLGVKRRVKKQPQKSDERTTSDQSLKRVFKTHLSHLPLDVVKLSSGAIVHVPNFVSQACECVEKCITHEGLFRKAGSHLRQKEIIARLDAGGALGEKYQVVDVANVLKTFFRNLPEPLIPYAYHDLLLRCAMLKNSRTEALLMACLLLPPHNLNTLAFFAEFLKRVARHEKTNKMGVDNLAKVVGPNVMPLQETTMSAFQSRLETHLVIVKILIENAERIGVLPEHVAEEVVAAESVGSVETELNNSPRSKNKKKKRRSGSLTRKPHLSASNLNLRMLNGLKKMVSKSGSPDEAPASNNVVSTNFNPAHTPSIKTGKKRKVPEPAAPLSAKKKREVLQTMPDGGLPTRQGTFLASIVSNDPNPCKDKSPAQKSRVRKYLALKVHGETEKLEKTKKTRLSLDRLVSRSKQKLADLDINVHEKASSSPKIERRWSSVSGSSWKKKWAIDSPTRAKEALVDEEVFMEADVNLSDDFAAQVKTEDQAPGLEDMEMAQRDEEYVTIPKSEYEEIKNRVSAIESRISQEFGCISTIAENLAPSSASKVQSEYEKTLEEASIGSTATADQLAKRLGKELKIRRSAEHKIIRSPSARKIGNLRRRSQEKPAGKRGSRHVSWLVSKQGASDQPPDELNNSQKVTGLKRGRPNTVYTGLTQPSSQPLSATDTICSDETNARLDFLQQQLHALINHTVEHTKGSLSDEDGFGSGEEEVDGKHPRLGVRRASSFHGSEFIDNSRHFNARIKELKKSNSQQDVGAKNEGNISEDKGVKWKDADRYFGSDFRNHTPAPQTGRASVAKLRTQNAGMVLAKARLFDDGETGQQSTKPGGRREIKSLDSDSSRRSSTPRRKHSKSPKNANAKLKLHASGASPLIKMELTIMPSSQRNVQKASDRRLEFFNNKNGADTEWSYFEHQKENKNLGHAAIKDVLDPQATTPCKTPHIKRPLTLKTPKDSKNLMRKQGADSRRTPMKAVALTSTQLNTPRRQSPRSALKSRQLTRSVS